MDARKEHSGQKLNEQDYDVQKFIVENAEAIVKGDTETISTSLTNMADRSEDNDFIKKAFHLVISIEHYAAEPQAAVIDAVKAVEKTVEKTAEL